MDVVMDMDTNTDMDKDIDMDMDTDIDMDIITPSLSHRQANFEISFQSLFRHCVPLKLPYGPSSIL
jgi:hypothetical protein